MAFITRKGKSYTVRHGVTGQPLSRHRSRKAANRRKRRLHRTHNPRPQNRGREARSRWRMGGMRMKR